MKDTAAKTLDYIWEKHGHDAEAMATKLAEFAWLEGWIAALEYLKTPKLTAPQNPYTKD